MLSQSQIEQIPLVREIRAYEREMLKDKPPCELGQCPKCRVMGDRLSFHRHDLRKRIFLVVVANFVYAIRSCLSRWKCSKCCQKFTVYPPFALPFKHYVAPEIHDRSQRYIERDEITYRRGVLNNQRPIFRSSNEDSQIDERSLAPSTLHRWISTLGQLPGTLRAAIQLIKQAAPTSRLFRQLANLKIHPRKFRSDTRKKILICGGQLLRSEEHFVRIFGRSIFPDLATRCAWR